MNTNVQTRHQCQRCGAIGVEIFPAIVYYHQTCNLCKFYPELDCKGNRVAPAVADYLNPQHNYQNAITTAVKHKNYYLDRKLERQLKKLKRCF